MDFNLYSVQFSQDRSYLDNAVQLIQAGAGWNDPMVQMAIKSYEDSLKIKATPLAD